MTPSKHLLSIIVAAVCCSALAAPCTNIEFSELNTYSDHDLTQLSDDYLTRAFEVGAPNSQFQGCMDQIKRIAKIRDARKKEKENSK